MLADAHDLLASNVDYAAASAIKSFVNSTSKHRGPSVWGTSEGILKQLPYYH